MNQIQHDEEYKLEHLKGEKPVEEHGRCRACRWWFAGGGQEPKDNNPRTQRLQSDAIGECRVDMPQLGIATGDGQKKALALWPVTFSNDWCAKYEPHKGKGGLAGKMKLGL
ncbi:MAG: hypothetical protein JXA82_19995 [Sedimentisphaerales bacterium]|nr:hypothetical protein [Sedimentisphaerales bacterium]